MLFSVRTIVSRRSRFTPLARSRAHSTAALRPTATALSAVKPGSESEATTPGSGSTEDIANSKGAYDGSSTDPNSSTSQIEHETDANFDQSSANKETSNMATQAQHQSDRRPSQQQQTQPSRHDLGATAARKQGGRGSSSQ